MGVLLSVFWIRDILVRIRTTDLRIRNRLWILLFSSVTSKTPPKIDFILLAFFAYYCLKINLHHYLKIKVIYK